MSSTTGDSLGPATGTAMADVAEAEAIVARAGYKPELRRSLRFFSMFAIAFSIISITTGIFLNYGFGLWVEGARTQRAGPWILALAVALNLGLLVYFKYASFLVDSLNWATSLAGVAPLRLRPIVMPIGISFYTFQAMSYVIDVHRGGIDEQRFRRPERDFQAVGDLGEGGQDLLRGDLGGGGGEQDEGQAKRQQPGPSHGWGTLQCEEAGGSEIL